VQSRRVVILVVSVVLGLLASLAMYSYLQGTQDRANEGAKLVQVFVVTHDIPKGLPGERAVAEGYIAAGKTPTRFRPASALTSLDAVKGKVALLPLSANQVVVDGLFVDPRVAQVTNSQRLDPGRISLTVALDGVRAAGGLLVPGDKVNILSQRQLKLDTVTPEQARRNFKVGDTVTAFQLLYQNVDILFIGATAAPQAGETQAVASPGGGVITFSVPVEAAERILLASTTDAGLYLTLVPPNNPALLIPPVGLHNLFGPECTTIGADNLAGTADDVPTGCVPLTPYAPTTTTTAVAVTTTTVKG
jgi:Flp pilus assembly protein CpaB